MTMNSWSNAVNNVNQWILIYDELKPLPIHRIRSQDWRENLYRYTSENEGATIPPAGLSREGEFFARNIIRIVNITSSLFLDKEARFMIKLDLLQVLRTECNDEDKLRTIFKYKEVIALFSVYIINRKKHSETN